VKNGEGELLSCLIGSRLFPRLARMREGALVPPPLIAKNPLLTIPGARLELSRFEGWGSGAGCTRVSTTDHCDHRCARAVGLHAHGRAGRGRAARRSRFNGLW